MASIYLQGIVDGVPVRALVDTGATTSVIRPEVLLKANRLVPPNPEKYALQTATGEMVTVLGCTTVPFSVGSLQVTLPVVVAAVDEQCILGVDFLKAHKCVLDFNAGLLHLGTDSFPLGAATVTVLCDSGMPINPTSPCLCFQVLSTNLAAHLLPLYERATFGLDKTDADQLRQLLERFPNLFSTGNTDLGLTSAATHQIVTGHAAPVRQPPRRVPLAQRSCINDMVKTMLQQGVIEPARSPWSSPVTLVKKKDGSTRFCVDYRRLNEVTKKDSFPLPRTDDILDALAGCTWFSTLDLKSGYWQVPVHPGDREKTAFPTGSG